MSKQTLQLHSTVLSIHSLDVDADIPTALLKLPLFFISKTQDELSIVCPSSFEIESLDTESDWQALEVVGPLGFSLTGIMANISGVLARAKISIFSISTYDTDYILVKKQTASLALNALKKDGYNVVAQ
ncbi:ACT domain-containing protein [Pseudoalteromonas distincta]|uniref:ACT domain-containing protein n=1 Tax=Pseudoalteromonas distincta TaxID=77608 RepID=UPI0011F36F11|nr:ACT domain-containing protein [Pseudoalteromonas distincta]KAA1160494.1 ACT domain-containing protein [Pseudoalteromonas distincta]